MELTKVLVGVAVLLAFEPVFGQAAVNLHEQFSAAEGLREEGKVEEAFVAMVKLPGAQHSAVAIGRPDPEKYLALLEKHREEFSTPLMEMVRADLYLAGGNKEKAIAAVRAVAKCTVAKEGEWQNNEIPAAQYLPDKPDAGSHAYYRSSLLFSFQNGPGSHRDNWLIRRALALQLPDIAAAEYKRHWEIHRSNGKPYVIKLAVRRENGKLVFEDRRFDPAGFDGKGLQFALDYAYFLKRQKDEEGDLAILREALLKIDMDRNPNRRVFAEPTPEDLEKLPRREPMPNGAFVPFISAWGAASSGVSRKEFLRLALGAFKSVGKDEALIEELRERSGQGENRLRRVLARLFLHEGRVDDALSLEAEFLKNAKFNARTTAYRMGRVYEEAGRNDEAVAQYEKAYAVPDQPVTLPDAEEITTNSLHQQARALPMVGHQLGTSKEALQADLAARLRRLYSSMGDAVKAFAATQRQFEASPALFFNPAQLEEAGSLARVAGAEDEFNAWLKKQREGKGLGERAALSWILKDYKDCAEALAELWKPGGAQAASAASAFETWRRRFAQVDADQELMFVEAVVKADPENVRARIALHELKKDFGSAEFVSLLESLLELVDPAEGFRKGRRSWLYTERSRGEFEPTKFRNPFDLAYRLMRIYQKGGDPKLLELGLRIAAGEKPFGPWWEMGSQRRSSDTENGKVEDLNSCLALLVQVADEKTLQRLAELWKDHGHPARRQLDRRRAGSFFAALKEGDLPRKDFGWANAPDGVRIIASNRSVLSLARDDRYLYSGHPWGIAVRTHDGQPVTRLALGEGVKAIATREGTIWLGTASGLYRVQRKDWTVAHMFLHGDVPENMRRSSGWFDNSVETLAMADEFLWIGTHRNVHRLNPATLEQRAYSYRELHIKNWDGFERILVDGDDVWVEGRSGLRRYNRESDTFTPVIFGDDKRPVGLIGSIDGVLYGHTWINETLRDRPCIIDRETLELRPILIETDPNAPPRSINGPFGFYGKYKGELVFGDGYAKFVYNKASGKLKPMDANWDRKKDPIQTILPAALHGEKLFWSQPVRSAEIAGEEPLGKVVGVESSYRCGLLIPTEKKAVALVGRFDSYSNDWPFGDIVWDRRYGSDGLTMVLPDRSSTDLTATKYGDTIQGKVVYLVVAEDDQQRGDDNWRKWLCTDLGVGVVDGRNRMLESFTRRNGLPCGNRISGGVAMGRNVYFASGWGDHGGGLVRADLDTGVFSAHFKADGLATDKLLRIERNDRALKIHYGYEYGGRSSRGYGSRVFASSQFDPDAGVRVGNLPQAMRGGALSGHLKQLKTPGKKRDPYLGGTVLHEQVIGAHKYISTTRGLVILNAEKPAPNLVVQELTPKVTTDPGVALEAAAAKVRIRITSPDDFKLLAASDNPYLRARAAFQAGNSARPKPGPYLATFRKLVDCELSKTRLTVARLLGEFRDKEALNELRNLLDDPERDVREAAAIALARIGNPPKTDIFARMLKRRNQSHDKEQITEALARTATPEVFSLLLKYPITSDSYEGRQKIFAQLGKTVAENPKLADVLLTAYQEGDVGPHSNWGTTRFAQEVFAHAGPPILPVLHEALKSEDRVVRSNAARGCGAIGHASSSEPLLVSLELESGLSRGSIVWALGELKSTAALPRLAKLYVDARNDEQRGRHSGFRYEQSSAAASSQFDTMSNLDSLASDYDEISYIAKPTPIRPRTREPLLNPKMILKAVKKIGPESSQVFYRTLAGEADSLARQEAATHLSQGGEKDREKNIAILRNLSADADMRVRMAAAVSLLILGVDEPQKQILQWLGAGASSSAIQELERIKDGKKLTFARKALSALATPERTPNKYQRDRILRLLSRIPRD